MPQSISLRDLTTLLEKFSFQADRMVVKSINKGLKEGKKITISTLQEYLNVSKTRLGKDISVKYAKILGEGGSVRAVSKPLALRFFKPRPRARGVSIQPLVKGRRFTIDGSFRNKSITGYNDIWKRRGKKRFPISRLYGHRISTAVENEVNLLVIQNEVGEIIQVELLNNVEGIFT
jgi:hypothetical protein